MGRESRVGQCSAGDLLGRGMPGWRRTLELGLLRFRQSCFGDSLGKGSQGEKNSIVKVLKLGQSKDG